MGPPIVCRVPQIWAHDEPETLDLSTRSLGAHTYTHSHKPHTAPDHRHAASDTGSEEEESEEKGGEEKSEEEEEEKEDDGCRRRRRRGEGVEERG